MSNRKIIALCRSEVSFNILDFPEKILITIILDLNARERIALSKTCKKLNSLIFDDQKLLRDLDFSQEGYLTSVSDVQQYFTDKTKHEYICKVNVSNVYCTRPAELLSSICKARNLVEVNIRGFKFGDLQEFGQFLEPLKQLEKLSSDWPTGLPWDTPWNKYLTDPFARLTHLSMTIHVASDKGIFFCALQLCQKLEELRLLQTYEYSGSINDVFWMRITKKLEKLKIVASCGGDTAILGPAIRGMLPDPDQWAKFYLYDRMQTPYFYFEKNLQVSQELSENIRKHCHPFAATVTAGWYLSCENLLAEAVSISQNIDTKEFCFSHTSTNEYMSLLEIKETKLLLKNPRYQVHYLNLNHDIQADCDVQLIGLAFPTLTKLVLTNIIKDINSYPEETDVKTGLKRKRTASKKQNKTVSPNPSFKTLVDRTPHLKDLTLRASSVRGYKSWDLPALYLISNWKSLTTLFLTKVPINSGRFLIEIGKQCINLEKLRLEDLGPRHACCYKKELLQMLAYCHNIKDFSIQQDNIQKVSDLFNALSTNAKLRRVCVKSLGKRRSVGNLLTPIEKLTRSCHLILLVCEIKGMTQANCDELNSILHRLKDELHRPLFEFEILRSNGVVEPVRNFSLDLVHKDLILSQRFTDAIYRLDYS